MREAAITAGLALAFLIVIGAVGPTLDHHDDLSDVQADLRDAIDQARASLQRRREDAARKLCGPDHTHQWVSDTTVSCSFNLHPVARAISQEAQAERQLRDKTDPHILDQRRKPSARNDHR